jgi:hypothetical protein
MKKTAQKLSLRKLTLSNLSKQSMQQLQGGEDPILISVRTTSRIDACPSRMDTVCSLNTCAISCNAGSCASCGVTCPWICDPVPTTDTTIALPG